MASRFSKVRIPQSVGGSSRVSGSAITKLAGLDLTTAVDEIAEGRTPDAKNFRLYKTTEGGRQAAVTTAKGQGYYTNTLNESLLTSNTASTGASTQLVGKDTNIHAQPFTAGSTGRITKVEVKLARGTADAAIRVDIHADDAGIPGKRISRSSIMDVPDTSSYALARFLNQVTLTSGQQYWIVVYLQDDGNGQFIVDTTTAGTKAWAGNSGLIGATLKTYGLNFRVYTAPESLPKNGYRFNRDDGVNRTILAYDTTMYTVVGTTLTPLVTGLSANATEYSFTNGDGKVFWVNGYDQLTAWNGTYESEAVNLLANGGFDINTTGWAGISGSTIARNTSDFNTTPASLLVTAASGIRGAQVTQALSANTRYKISYWVKGATTTGNTFVTINGGTTALTGSTNSLTSTWTKREFYYTPGTDVTTIEFKGASDNIYIDDVVIKSTGIEYIIDTELPILKDVVFHKDRMFGVSASDQNKIVFSENPGNPSDQPANKQWYYQWLSVSFVYVPRPKNGSPIVAIIPFQDNLAILTQDSKYILSGSDRGNFFLRESSGSQGAISKTGITSDANFIYFVSDDGIYRFNGAKDDKMSKLIQPIFDDCPSKRKISLALWNSSLRVYLASQFSTVIDRTAILDLDFNEWTLDTDTYVSRGLYYSDADDQMELVEFSSLTPTLYYAEQDFNRLGAPIDFRYTLKYDSRGVPGQRKKYKRYVPLVQAVGNTFPITYGFDKDFEGTPSERQETLSVGGAKIGEFFIGDGTTITGSTAFKPKRTSISGYSYYMQFGVKRDAVNNQVAFMGVQFTFKAKKL